MSSLIVTTSPSFLPTSTSSSTASSSSSTSDGGGPGTSKGANYFFGFLITFIVLLLLFIACGVGTRRRFTSRRRALMFGNLDAWDGMTGVGARARAAENQVEPTFWEPVLEKGSTNDYAWKSLKPLSVSVVRRKLETKETDTSPTSTGAGTITALDRLRYIFQTPSWLQRASPFQDSNALAETAVDRDSDEPPEAVQVAIMIGMPGRRGLGSQSQAQLPEYHIGVVQVPWNVPLGELKV